MSVRRNGADDGTLKTRMGFLIRSQDASWHGRDRGGSRVGLEHDSEKHAVGRDPRVIPVFRKACPRARPEGSCSIENLKRDRDLIQNDRALAGQATLARNASSAARTASGVPTCIQTPSSRSPNSRSCSPTRSNIFVSENAPLGASANSDGDMMATPA